MSGEFSLPYVRIRELLLQHLSPILVDSVLRRALETRRASPATLAPADLAELTSDIMVGLRLFVPERELPGLMVELAAVIGEEER